MIKPITPEEARKEKISRIPDFIIESFNEAIIESYNSITGISIVKQTRILEIIMGKTEGSIIGTVFKEGFLDVEEIYRSAGWSVEYDKPSFDGGLEARFIFTKKK